MSRSVTRRRFLQTAAVVTAGAGVGASTAQWLGHSRSLEAADQPAAGPQSRSPADPGCPVIDTHTHFYDPTRKEGVPWPGADDKILFRPVLPDEFAKLTRPFGVTGTVVVEASPWVADNDWLLDLAKRHPQLVGIVGNLSPGSEQFRAHLDRLAANPKYRGFRIGQGALKAGLGQRQFVDDCRYLSKLGLTLDVNGGPDMPADVAALAQLIPDLTIVINHLANVRHDGKNVPENWRSGITAAAKSSRVYCKVSALVEGTGLPVEQIPREVNFYRPVLDAAAEAFGENRLMYGSNWPVSARYAPYEVVQRIAVEYFRPRGPEVLKRVFSENAREAYRWPAVSLGK